MKRSIIKVERKFKIVLFQTKLKYCREQRNTQKGRRETEKEREREEGVKCYEFNVRIPQNIGQPNIFLYST